MLDARRLRVLCEVARQGSFSAAAEALGYTQPAVSRQIATLEAEVGAVLVRRVPQGAVLTDAGRLLAERGESVLAQLKVLEVELQALAGLEGGRLRLASFASAAAAIIPPAIAEFRARHPKVEISVEVADPLDSLPQLRAGELDIAISHDPMGMALGRTGSVIVPADAAHQPAREDDGVERPRDGAGVERPRDGAGVERGAATAGLEFVSLFDDPMYVAMPVGHRLADIEALELGCFASEPWMLATTHSCPDSRLFLRACHDAGFEPTIAFQNDDYPAILGFVAAGVGVALVPDMVVRGLREDVVVRALDPAPPPRPIMAVLPAGYRSPAAAAMLDVLGEVGERWVTGRVLLSSGTTSEAAA